MTISVKHKFQTAKANSADPSRVRASNWNDEHNITLAASKLMGRASSTDGAVQEVTLGAGFSFSGTTLNFSVVGQLGFTPVNKAGDTMTGDLTIQNSAPRVQFKDTTTGAYSGRIRVDANKMYIEGSADGATYTELGRFELDTKFLTMPYLRLTSNTDASLTSTLHALQIGSTAGANLIFDTNELISRNNGVRDNLYITTKNFEIDCTDYDSAYVNKKKIWNDGNLPTPAQQYTGSDNAQTVFPIGHPVLIAYSDAVVRNGTLTVRLNTSSSAQYVSDGTGGTALTGTWRARGSFVQDGQRVAMFQRTA